MKAIILAAAMCAMYFAAMTFAFLFTRPETLRARLMLLLFAFTLPVGVAIHYLTPSDLGFLPYRWCEPDTMLDLAFFLFLYTAVFFGFILQLYNLADRGFSLRIVIDIDRSPDRYMTVEQIMTSYSAGQGISWMYQKRMDDLARLDLIRIGAGMAEATPAGRRVASRFTWLRRFLRVAD